MSTVIPIPCWKTLHPGKQVLYWTIRFLECETACTKHLKSPEIGPMNIVSFMLMMINIIVSWLFCAIIINMLTVAVPTTMAKCRTIRMGRFWKKLVMLIIIVIIIINANYNYGYFNFTKRNKIAYSRLIGLKIWYAKNVKLSINSSKYVLMFTLRILPLEANWYKRALLIDRYNAASLHL